jgi:predicted nucleic acid-binding Zn ribbon protein
MNLGMLIMMSYKTIYYVSGCAKQKKDTQINHMDKPLFTKGTLGDIIMLCFYSYVCAHGTLNTHLYQAMQTLHETSFGHVTSFKKTLFALGVSLLRLSTNFYITNIYIPK